MNLLEITKQLKQGKKLGNTMEYVQLINNEYVWKVKGFNDIVINYKEAIQVTKMLIN